MQIGDNFMRVLFINPFKLPDYLNDMIYHGLIDSGIEVYETSNPDYMLKSYPNPSSLYGRGFSVFAKLSHMPRVEESARIIEKIRQKFYTCVFYGSVQRDVSYLDVVNKHYPKGDVHFFDGEDSPFIHDHLLQYGIYWKRECIDPRTKPINFAIPESQLLQQDVEKTKMFGTIIPGWSKTYIFTDEKSYYNDYAVSNYGITKKKHGWDCMRHYEILANKCVPYFLGLEKCPSTTMWNFPKEIILETNKYAKMRKIHPNYDKINDELFDYTKKNLTTKALIKTILG